MVSLELEARLDNLLSTAQEETIDIDIFAPIPEREECPICLIPLPNSNEVIYLSCCGKRICKGCINKNMITGLKKGKRILEQKCAFCQQTLAPGQKRIKSLKKLMKKNDPYAFIEMARCYKTGDWVFQSETKSLEMYIRAAELGHAVAFGKLGLYYEEGVLVEQDTSKALEYHKIAAKKGSLNAHGYLSHFHGKNRHIQTSIKHMKVAASAGDKGAIDGLMAYFKDKFLSKEDLTQSLRAYQATNSEIMSKDRENARLFEESSRKGETPPAQCFE